MTTIQPYWEPHAEARETPARTSNGNRRIVVFAAAALLALTALNLAATAYLAAAIAELRVAEERLAKLSSFERRIMERLELVNNGVQSQFDNMLQVTDGRLAALRQEIEAARGRPATDSFGERSVAVALEDELQPAEAAPGPASEPASTPAKASLVDAGPAPAVARRAPPAPNSAYQRIEGPDGKVTYKRLK